MDVGASTSCVVLVSFGGDYYSRTFDVISNTMPTTTTGATDACYNHFQGLAANSFYESLTGVTVDSTSLSFSTTSENTPLNGNGLQLGYNFEKFRVSLNFHLWSAGENKLDSQLLLLDYFLPYGLYAGGGFGTAKLDTSIGSASKTAPALHFGYQHNFTDNFSLEAECGGCLGSRAYTRIQFSRTKTPSCIKPVREEVIQQ